MRTGLELRVSTPVSTACGSAKPCKRRSSCGRALLHGARHERREALVQVAPCDAARVGGLHLLARAAGAMRQEIADGLRGRLIRFAAGGDGGSVGRLLHLTLQLDARKRVFAVEILGAHADQQRAVGVLPIAREAAHAVDHHAFRLAGGAHHFPTWAHAERVHAAALFFAFFADANASTACNRQLRAPDGRRPSRTVSG